MDLVEGVATTFPAETFTPLVLLGTALGMAGVCVDNAAETEAEDVEVFIRSTVAVEGDAVCADLLPTA